MIDKDNRWRIFSTLLLTIFIILGCSIFSGSESNPTPTPTATVTSGLITSKSRCDGLTGSLELQILVGPSDAVGLEPYAVGEIPFAVVADGESYKLEGGGPLNYNEEILESEWGTFTVKFQTDTVISGTCVFIEDVEALNINLVAIGEQMVEVRAEGFQMDYPWSGTPELAVSFPLEEGARQEGEGWVLILHLDV